MRAFEFLTESTGLAGRNPGDNFASTTGGSDIEFSVVTFYPNVGQFEAGELATQVEDFDNQFNITWVNKAPKAGGFGIAEFTTSTGEIKYYGRFFKNINAMKSKNTWANTNGIPGY